MKKRFLFCLSLAGFMSAGISVALANTSKDVKEVEGYSTSSLPTTIDLNDTSEANIRSYYSSLNNKSTSERQGNNLLKNLKTILKNGQKYYKYDSSDTHWKMYEITDRDWTKSPASSITGYDSSTKIITGYTYGTSTSSKGSNPYIHALYNNRDVDNQARAWDSHGERGKPWTIEREHIWAKSQGFDSTGSGGARGDPMHLLAANGTANGNHSSYYFGYVDTSKSYTDSGSTHSNASGNLTGSSKTFPSSSTKVFEPQDSDKGDIARAIFYMVARYNYLAGGDSIDSNNPNLALTQSLSDWASSGYDSTTSKQGKMGIMTDLLAWHHADPVDEYEIHRNNLLYTNFTNNRNPFIDFPEWADFIWGSVNYNGRQYVSHSTTPTGYATPSSDTINGYNGGSSDPVAVTGVSLNKVSASIESGSSEVLTATVSPYNATNQGVSWSSNNTSVATVSNTGRVTAVAEGNATITVTTSDGGFTATCAVTVTPASSGGDITWTKVTDASDLLAGDKVVIVANNSDYALSTTQNANNRGQTGVTKTGNTVSWTGSDVQELILATGSVSNTFAFGTGSGYLYAAGSGKNLLKTQNSIDENASFTVSISNGVATLTAQGSNTNNLLKYNSDSSIFSCYASGQKDVCLYKGEKGSVTPEPTLSSIAVKTAPTKLTYTVGDGFAPAGLVITATYSDSSTADIPYEGNEDAFEFDPIDDLQTSNVSVTISYGGKTCTQGINVAPAKTLSSITLNTDNVKKTFYQNDTFEHENLVVTAHFSDSSSDVVSSSATVSTPDMSTTGEKTIMVSYTYSGTTKTASYTISVIEGGGEITASQRVVSKSDSAYFETGSIYLSGTTSQGNASCDAFTATQTRVSGSTSVPYTYDEIRVYANHSFMITPNSGYTITSVVLTANSSDYAKAVGGTSVTNCTKTVSGSTVTLTPTDGTSVLGFTNSAQSRINYATVNYSYSPAVSLSSITLDTSNVQTTFSVGDTFNYTGLVVTAHYSDLSSKTVTPTSVSSPNMSTTGNKTVTVTYTEDEVTKTETYSITVNANPSISWTAPTINVYSGSTLSGSDVNAWAVTYNDGAGHQTVLTYSQLTIKLGGTTISIPHTWSASDDGKTLTATYNSLTTSASSGVQVTQSINSVYKETYDENTWSHIISSKTWSAYGTQTINGKSWTAAVPNSDGANWGYDSTKGQQFGKAADPCSVLTLSTSAFSGTISTVKVSTSGASGVTATVAVTVGSTVFKCSGSESASISASNTEYTFTGSGSGTITITWTNTSAKALYVKELSITTVTPSGSTQIANDTSHIAAQRVAVKFANAFNAAMDTTNGCTTNLSSAWSTCSSAYNTFKTEAAALGSTEEAYAKNLIKYATAQYSNDSGEACIERMMKTYEVCVNKHGQTAFMSELVTLSRIPINPLQISVKNSSTTIIIIVIASISVITIGGYFYFRRKKD